MRVLFVSDMEPNPALMKIARDEVNKGNEVGINISNPDVVYCSWVFQRNARQTTLERFKGTETKEGGFYVDPKVLLPDDIEHLMPYYPLYENGSTNPRMGYTSRGCNGNCPWCIVTDKEGRLHDNGPISEFWDGKDPRLYLLDNDFIGSPNRKKNTDFMVENKIKINYHQGLNIRKVTDKIVREIVLTDPYLVDFKTHGCFFAWDDTKDEKRILKGIECMVQYWPASRLNFYVLGGFPNGNEFDDLYYRCKVLTGLGIRPYVMPFNDDVIRDIKDLKRCINTGIWKKRGLDEAWRIYTRRRRKIA